MKEHSIRPMQGLPPAERAVKYLLDILPLYPELSYYLCPGTNMMRLLCEAEAQRLGIEPDPTYEPGIFSSRFEQEYCAALKPKDPREGWICPECASWSREVWPDKMCRECGEAEVKAVCL